MAAAPALSMVDISKRYGACVANRAVSLEVPAGQVHAIVGENGAGKSTLMRIAYGMLRADSGTITLRGTRVERPSVRRSIELGLGMVHQHFMLAPTLTVVENVVLGREPMRGLVVDLARAAAEVATLSQRYGLGVEPGRRVSELGVGELQRVEIVKVLWRGAEVVILDEPTAVLGPSETQELLRVIGELRAAGKTVILITHKLDEVMAVADAVTVLRAGEVALRVATKDTSPAALARAMIGRDLSPTRAQAATPGRDVVLSVAGDGLDLTVHAGEIVGIAGVEGNGQRELVEGIAGLSPLRAEVRLGGAPAGRTVAARLLAGLGHVPEDRHKRGLVLDFSVADNLALGRLGEFAGRLGLDRARLRAHAETLIREFDVRPTDPTALARTLSGGNQQKLVLARELTRPGLRALLCAQPTRGVDIAAAEVVHQRILAARAAGVGVLLVSTELGELLELCDRIAVMLRGRIVGMLTRAEASAERLGALMTGATAGAAA